MNPDTVRKVSREWQAAGNEFPRMSVATFTREQCAKHSDRIAINDIETGVTLTYADLWTRIISAAAGLHASGIGPGDRVAIQMHNGWEYPVLWLALAQIGAVHVPVNTRYTNDEISYVLHDSGAALFLVADDLHADLDTQTRAIASIKTVEGFLDQSRSLAPSQTTAPSPDALLNIQYTSGTTGMPKGCMLSHDYWLVLARSAALWDGTPVQRILSAQPYFYMDPQWITLKTLLNGATMFIAPGLSSSRFLGWLLDHKIDWCMFPIVMARLTRTGRESETSLTQCATFGWDAQTASRFHEDYGVRAREGFGMTEIGLGTAMHASFETMRSSASTGLAGPCRETSVRHEDGTVAAAGEQGELWVRGRSIFQGYWNRPDATAEACPGDGWFRTGDLFKCDADGFHWITGRTKDMIRRSSENIAAREVEAALCTLPGILEAAALAEPEPMRGEEVLAVLQHADGQPDEEAAQNLITKATANLAGRLASFKIPRYWVFVTKYPRTASNKVQKPQLRSSLSGKVAYDCVERGWIKLP